MRKTRYTVKTTSQFKKDYKLAIKRGLKIELLENIVSTLAMGEQLPEKSKDHALHGDWTGHRECHIFVWKINKPPYQKQYPVRRFNNTYP